MYNLLDANEAVIKTNISEEAAILLLEDTTTIDGFSYFYYPNDSIIIEKLKGEKGESIRFLKSAIID